MVSKASATSSADLANSYARLADIEASSSKGGHPPERNARIPSCAEKDRIRSKGWPDTKKSKGDVKKMFRMKEVTKKFSAMLLLTCVLVLSILFSGTAAVHPATASSEGEMSQITVTGCGSVSVSPDQAKVSLGVLTIAPTAGEAQRENSSKANKIINALVAAGVPKEKIATQNYTIWPECSYPKPEENKPPTITAYRVSNTILVTLDDITKVGQVIDTAVAAGANQVESIQFLRQDTSSAQREALQKACQEARRKADAIAQSLGLQILGVQSVQESSSVTLPPILYQGVKALETGHEPTPIEPGEIKISATVNIVFNAK